MKRKRGGKVSKLQEKQIRFLRSLDCKAEVLTTPNQVDMFLERIQKDVKE